MNKIKKKVENGLSDIQKDFANAIDYDALEKALKNKEVRDILNKIK